MKSKFLVLFILFSNYSFSQNITIVGWIYDYSNNRPMPNVNEFFETFGELKSGSCTDSNGKFILNVKKEFISGELKISFINYRIMYFTNLPETYDTIDLGRIPLFENQIEYHDIIILHCGFFAFKCKYLNKSFSRELNKRNQEYIYKINQSIQRYSFIFNGQVYRLKKYEYNRKREKLNYKRDKEFNFYNIVVDLSKPE
ncbi:MAG: hypothetical protein ACOYO1_02735 [Bacteroidales bacterium]